MTGLSAPLLNFGDNRDLPEIDAYLRENLIERSFAMTGPGESARPGHLPVRGDLAHVRLAGRWFVPHYAVPMLHSVITEGAELRLAAKPAAEVIEALAAGTEFNVLDIAGGWAWGQVGEDGCVGYLPLETIRPA